MSNVEVRVSEIEGPVEMDDKSDSESKSDVYLDDSEEDMILGLDDGFGDYATMNLTPKEVIEKLNNDLQHGVNPTFTKDMEGDYKSESFIFFKRRVQIVELSISSVIFPCYLMQQTSIITFILKKRF